MAIKVCPFVLLTKGSPRSRPLTRPFSFSNFAFQPTRHFKFRLTFEINPVVHLPPPFSFLSPPKCIFHDSANRSERGDCPYCERERFILLTSTSYRIIVSCHFESRRFCRANLSSAMASSTAAYNIVWISNAQYRCLFNVFLNWTYSIDGALRRFFDTIHSIHENVPRSWFC